MTPGVWACVCVVQDDWEQDWERDIHLLYSLFFSIMYILPIQKLNLNLSLVDSYICFTSDYISN